MSGRALALLLTVALVVVALVGLWAWDVGHEGLGDEPPVRLLLGPGDDLRRHLEHLRVVRAPASSWPEDVAEVLAREDRRLLLPLDARGWRSGGDVPAALASLAGLEGGARLWRHRGARGVELSFEGAEVLADGATCAPVTATPAGDALPAELRAWDDGAGRVLFVDTRHRELMAIGPDAPGEVRVRFDADPLEDARRWEPFEPPQEGGGAGMLVRHAEFGRSSRRAVLLPAPGAVELPCDGLRAEALRVAVGLPAHGYRVADGGLVPDPRASDGVVCAVDLVADDGTRTRLWSQAVQPGEGWIEATVPLPLAPADPEAPRPVTLQLVTEPGSAGDAAFDHALFADLTLVGEPVRPDPRPHVVLLVLDTLRADRLGCYGAARDTSPRIDAWAASQALVFTDCSASSSWTLPSTATLLTGLLPHQHGVDRPSLRLSGHHSPLAERLFIADYETRAVAEGGYVSASFGFDLGFERFDTRRSQDPDFDAVLDALADRRSERPLFLLLHTYLAHAPYEPDPRWVDPDYDGALAGQEVDADNVFAPHRLGQLELTPDDGAYIDALYDAGVRRLDALVGDFLERLDTVLPPEDTLVILTSDHGEELLEHGGLDHGLTLYDEVLRVPLLIRFPEPRPGGPQWPGPGRVTTPVGLADVVPTVLDVVGHPHAKLPGVSLGRAVPTGRLLVAELADRQRALRLGDEKLIEALDATASASADEAGQLYDLQLDPGERIDRAAERAGRIAELRARWEALAAEYRTRADAARSAEVDADTLEALDQLGYAADGRDP